MRPQEIIDMYKQGEYRQAAEALLTIYETEFSDSNIGNKFRRGDVLQRLGWEMSQDPVMLERLAAIAPKLCMDDKIYVLFLVPELMESLLPEQAIPLYRRQLEQLKGVFCTDSLEGITEGFDAANKLGIAPSNRHLNFGLK